MNIGWTRQIARLLVSVLLAGSTITSHAQSLSEFQQGDGGQLREAEVSQDTEEPTGVAALLGISGLLTPASDNGLSNDIALIGYNSGCDSCSSTNCCSVCNGDCNSCRCPLPNAPCITCPHVSTQNPYFNISIFGALKLDMLFNEARPVSPGTPFYLFPEAIAGFDENSFDMHARQSTLGAALAGPQFGGFQSGGLVMAMFYNDAVIVDQYGFLPLQAYGELRSDDWRFAAGLQFDVFSPRVPTVLPFSALGASGNAGNSFRGQLRLERFIRPSADRQGTIQLALSEPISSTIDPTFRLSEDNGWPNVEGRIALGCGCPQGAGAAARRPFELGISGVVGQIRTTDPLVRQVVADVWGVSTDFYWKATDRFGIAGELFTGQTLGTYNAGVLQNINADTLEGIESSGGWIELFTYWTQCVHSHLGYGIDDPQDSDVVLTGRTRNETYFANTLWDINPTFRVGFELTWRETQYRALPDNDGVGFHTQFQWAF
jgi:hypothetical protein